MPDLIMTSPELWPKLQAELPAFTDFPEHLTPDIWRLTPDFLFNFMLLSRGDSGHYLPSSCSLSHTVV